MNGFVKLALGLAATGSVALGQVVTPIWVQHLNGEVNVGTTNRLPILVKNVGGSEGGGDGTSTMVSLGRFLRYDSQRFLLLVRENGINETAAGHNAALAAAYPDNSLIWIDANTGAPLGLAHVFGVHPVTVTGQASQNDYYHEWGMDEDVDGKRVLYSGHKNVILRWAPKTGGGWESVPTCAWVEPTVGASDCAGNALDESTSGDGNQSMRWREFRVTGSGTNTEILAGGGTWRAGAQPQLFKTTDGRTFRPAARIDDRNNGAAQSSYALGGQVSHIVKYGLDPSRPNLVTAYSGHFPGSGYSARPNRYQADLANPEVVLTHSYAFAADGNVAVLAQDDAANGNIPAFVWEAAGKDGLPQDPKVDGVDYYDGNWSAAMDANGALDYVVNYSIPSWNSQDGGVYGNVNLAKPGWIGVHRLDGSISPNSAWKLPCTELDAATPDESPASDPIVGNAWGYCGDIKLYPSADAAANLKSATFAWSGGAYGFGLFKVENVAAAIVKEPQDVVVTENKALTISAEISGSPITYQWYKDGVALDGSRTNLDGTAYYPATVAQGVKKAKLHLPFAIAADAGKYRLVATSPLGTVTTREAQITVDSDSAGPTISAVQVGRSASASYLQITFSEAVTPETAGASGNYKLSGGVNVTGAQVVSTTSVIVYTGTLTPGTPYTLTVNGVKDISARGNVIAANTTQTLTGPALTPGVVLWEYWLGIEGSDVESLQASANYPGMPSGWRYMTNWNTDNNGLSAFAENYGSRTSGWLTPAETGSYRFFIASDDASRLYLSPNSAAAGAVEIASEIGCCNAFAEPDSADPASNGSKLTSDPVTLTAGQSYYIYLDHKEGGGGDWSKVAWRKEGDTTAAANLAPIPGAVLSAYRTAAPVESKFNVPVLNSGQLSITWSGTGTLAESIDLKTWTAVAGNPASPYVITPSAQAKFYRLQQ